MRDLSHICDLLSQLAATPDPSPTEWSQGSNPHPPKYVEFLTRWAPTCIPVFLPHVKSTCLTHSQATELCCCLFGAAGGWGWGGGNVTVTAKMVCLESAAANPLFQVTTCLSPIRQDFWSPLYRKETTTKTGKRHWTDNNSLVLMVTLPFRSGAQTQHIQPKGHATGRQKTCIQMWPIPYQSRTLTWLFWVL